MIAVFDLLCFLMCVFRVLLTYSRDFLYDILMYCYILVYVICLLLLILNMCFLILPMVFCISDHKKSFLNSASIW